MMAALPGIDGCTVPCKMASMRHHPWKTTELFIGPPRPPSRWRLDHVPTPILNNIVDYLGWEALLLAPDLYLYKPGDSLNNHRPFSLDLKSMSLVDWAFRNNVMGRQIFHTISLHSVENMRRVDNKLSEQSRKHFRRMILVPPSRPESDKAASKLARQTILSSMTNLEELFDHSGAIIDTAHALPGSLRQITLLLNPGNFRPLPLETSSLHKLRIETSNRNRTENVKNTASQFFGKKLRAICNKLQELDTLSLVLPGLSTCVCSHAARLPEDKVYKDVLPAQLSPLKCLELEIPFCVIKPNGPRESHWWGYLGWLFDTPVQFEKLTISMSWVPFTIVTTGPPSLAYIRENMGLEYEVKDPSDPEPIPLDSKRFPTLDVPLERFFKDLFDKRPGLGEIQLVMSVMMDCNPNKTGIFRVISAKRIIDGSNGKFTMEVADEINTPIIADACDDVFSVFGDGWFPPSPHEAISRLEMEAMFPPMFDPTILAEVEAARIRVEGPRAERTARAAARSGGRVDMNEFDFPPRPLSQAARDQVRNSSLREFAPTNLSTLD